MRLLSRRRGLLMKLKRFMRKVSGVPPISLIKSTGDDIYDYKIYGNSVQSGTPTPDTPIEIESVGERTQNLLDIDKGLNVCFTWHYNDGYEYTITKTDASRFSADIPINLKADTKYVMCYELIDTNSTYKAPLQISFSGGTTGISSTLNYTSFTPKTDISAISIYQEGSMPVGTYTTFKNLQIIEGSVPPTEYEPFGYKIPVKVSNGEEEIVTNIFLDEPLRKIGEYADYIDFGKGNTFQNRVVRNIRAKSLASSLSWIDQYYPAILINLSGEEVANTSNDKIVLSKYATNPYISILNDYGTSLGFDKCDEYWNFKNVDELKEWLDGHTDMVAYYVLQTPIEDTRIYVPQLPTFKGDVVYTVDTKTQPSNMEITYYSEESE